MPGTLDAMLTPARARRPRGDAEAATGGDPQLSVIGSVLAEPARARMLAALTDGRALAAGVLASEAGVAASTASGHLGRLLDAGFVTVEAHGRHRYYRLASADIADLLERLSSLVPTEPVRSLRASTRAHAMRRARTCYDHLAGRLGVALLDSFLARGWITGHDGSFRPDVERLSAPGPDLVYELSADGEAALTSLGVPCRPRTVRPVLRHCVDWSEQRHHLSGHLGAALAAHLFASGWIERGAVPRSVTVTPTGRDAIAADFAVHPDAYA